MSKSNNLPVNGQGMSKTKEQTNNFTQIANHILLDQRLSFKARGILTLLLSRPKSWKIYIDEIVERSDVDGKHSIRTGFKELKEFGYLQLVKVWNDDTGKFEGTVYQLCVEPLIVEPLHCNRSTDTKNDSPALQKSDKPISRPTENLSVEKSDRPKTYTPSNTNSSNTKHSNIIIQQQQKANSKNDDDDNLKNESKVAAASAAVISSQTAAEAAACPAVSRNLGETSVTTENQTAATLLPFLEKDEIWKKQFIGQDICKPIGTTEILTVEKFDLLLKHFGQTSISSGTTYINVTAIKRHFFNWFHANLNKNALVNYIGQQTAAPKKARKQVATLMPKTNAILNKIYSQQCDNEAHLFRCLQLLATHLAIYENALQHLDLANQKAVHTWINDIEYAKNLVERGRKAGQLSWFSKRTTTLQSGAKTKNVNNLVNGLSQRFTMAQH